MDTKDTGQTEIVSELQAEQMGYPEQMEREQKEEGWRDQNGRIRPPRGYCSFGLVYFVQTEDGRIKIGFTRRLGIRLRHLRAKLKCEIRLIAFFPGASATEAWIHDRFAEYRIHGDLYDAAAPIVSFARHIGFPVRYAHTWRAMIQPECWDKAAKKAGKKK